MNWKSVVPLCSEWLALLVLLPPTGFGDLVIKGASKRPEGLTSRVVRVAEPEKGSALRPFRKVEPSEAPRTYTVQGTTQEQEELLRTQIRVMDPAVLPHRVVFVPHWQYIYATKMYHLRVPTGMTSTMFTHLASRSVYIDRDLQRGDLWLGRWMAHELGHLEKNSVDENDAEKAAAKYRRRLELTRANYSVEGFSFQPK